MNSLDDLLAIIPGLRHQRSIGANFLRILLDRKNKECTWCGSKVPKKKSKWCSKECVNQFLIRCSDPHRRQYVTERDRGLCQLCGHDTIEAEKAYRKLSLFERITKDKELKKQQDKFYHKKGIVFREVDHIVPVSRGGGLCPVDMLRLLCATCHSQETRKLR